MGVQYGSQAVFLKCFSRALRQRRHLRAEECPRALLQPRSTAAGMMDVTGPQRTTFASSKMLGFGWGNPIIARPAREARPLSAGPLTASSAVLSRMRSAIPSSKWDSLHATSACFHSAGHAAVASTIGPRPRVYAAGAVRPQSAGSCVPRPATSPQCAAHWLIHITSVCFALAESVRLE